MRKTIRGSTLVDQRITRSRSGGILYPNGFAKLDQERAPRHLQSAQVGRSVAQERCADVRVVLLPDTQTYARECVSSTAGRPARRAYIPEPCAQTLVRSGRPVAAPVPPRPPAPRGRWCRSPGRVRTQHAACTDGRVRLRRMFSIVHIWRYALAFCACRFTPKAVAARASAALSTSAFPPASPLTSPMLSAITVTSGRLAPTCSPTSSAGYAVPVNLSYAAAQ